MTVENPLPNPFLGQAESELGVATGSRLAEKDIYILEEELRDAAEAADRAGRNGTNNEKFRRAKANYDKALRKLNLERSKLGLKPVASAEEMEDEKGAATADLTQLENRLQVATELNQTKQVKELEQKIAEVQAARTSSKITPSGVVGISQTGLAGYVPDLDKGKPILNPDFTFTIVDQNNNPIVVKNQPLQSVFLVFEDKNFYERGVKTTVKNIVYRNAEDIRSLAFSLSKNDRKKLQEEFKQLQLLPSNYNANGELDRDAAFENAFLQAHTFANRVNYQRLQNNEPILGLSDAIKQYRSDEGLDQPTVSRDITEFAISDGQAEGLLEEFYTRALGVRPSQQDINQFKEIVRKRAGKKPRVTETTTTADGRTSTTKTVETGFGAVEAELLARRQAEARPEFAPYQMATTFYDSILRAAQSPVRLQDTGL